MLTAAVGRTPRRRREAGNDAFRRAREEREWSRGELAEYTSELAGRRGYSWVCTEEYVRELEVNDVRPEPWRRKLFCDLFEQTPEALGFPTPPAALRRYDPEADADEMDQGRRTALKGIGAVLAAPLLDPAVHPLCRLADMSLAMAADGAEELVANLGHAYSAGPPAALRQRLSELNRLAASIADSTAGRYADRFRDVAGWSAGLLANALFDLGDPAAAATTILLALGYAEQTRDARLMAYARERQAMMTGEGGDYAGALEYVEQGLQAAPTSTAIRVRLLSARAQLNARLHRRDQALADLGRHAEEHGRLPAEELGDGSFKVMGGSVDSTAGPVLLLLGELAAARKAQEGMLAQIQHRADLRPTRLALRQTNLATIHLRSGQPDEAIGVARAALSSAFFVLPARRRLRAFVAELLHRQPDLPAARRFCEEYQAHSV